MGARRNSFYDFSQARGPRKGPDVGRDVTDQLAPAPGPSSDAMTVSSLIARIKGALSDSLPAKLTVAGELSNVKRHSSGHMYFRLKDASSSIDAMMWRSSAAKLAFDPVDGLEVVAEGNVDVYDVRGQLQLYVRKLTPKGAGALELAFRQLKAKLEAEGLFSRDRKKPIPRMPRGIGVVTSPTGAAIRDIRRTLSRRWPAARVYLVPVRVQGASAAGEIAEAIARLDGSAERFQIDTLIVGRGGGSLEDLWAFNEEIVARAIAGAGVPIISAVGHEVDVTISDLVADARAATPTAAGELAVPDAAELDRTVTAWADRLARGLANRVAHARSRLDGVQRSVVFRDPAWRVRTQNQRLDEWALRLVGGVRQQLSAGRQQAQPLAQRLAALHPARLAERASARLERASHRLSWAFGGRIKREADRLGRLAQQLAARDPRHRLALARQRLAATARQLEAMSYRSVLQRGFSVTRLSDGAIVRSANEVASGERIETELADGRFTSTVAGSSADESAEPPGPAQKQKQDAPPARRRSRRRPPADDQPKLFD